MDAKALEHKTALVTGSGKGIGRAVAELLAAQGAHVIVTARTVADVEATCAAIQASGGAADAVPGDLTKDDFVQLLFDTIRDRFGRLDILVNNAGIAPFGRAEDLPVQRFRDVLELNIVAAFACTQQAIRIMRETSGAGKIINVGSIRSHWTESGDAGAYNASKFGLLGMTESIARQLHNEKGNKISVGIVSPGIVDTTLTNPSCTPQPGWLRPETVAGAVLHAVTVPDNINVFQTVLFPTTQSVW